MLLVSVSVLGYFSASRLKDTFEYRFSDHPSALCGNWLWKSRNGSALTLYAEDLGSAQRT